MQEIVIFAGKQVPGRGGWGQISHIFSAEPPARFRLGLDLSRRRRPRISTAAATGDRPGAAGCR